MCSAAVSAKRGSVFSPVPTAVPPSASSCRPGSVPRTVASAWSSWATQPEMTWPSVTGVASCRCVRPTMTTSANSSALAASVSRSSSIAGMSSSSSSTAAAMCITAGKVSLLDCPRLTSSLGWIGVPGAAPRAGELVGAVGDDLVGVHVALRAAAGLEDDQRELGVERAVHDLGGGARDELGLVLRQPAELLVGPRRRQLEHAERPDHPAAPAEVLRADGEVLERALRLRAPVVLRPGRAPRPCCRARCASPRPCR